LDRAECGPDLDIADYAFADCLGQAAKAGSIRYEGVYAQRTGSRLQHMLYA